MGAESNCTCRFEGRVSEGTAHLDSSSLIFRGDFRLSIPLKDVTHVEARNGCLTFISPSGTVSLELGKATETWASKIKNPKGLLDKLGVKPGARVCVIGVQDQAFLTQLQARTDHVVRKPPRDADLVFYAADSVDALDSITRLKASLKPDGAIWVVSLKGKRSRIKDTDVMAAARAAGLVANKVVGFSETHTALKLVVPKAMR
ncbi:MAG: DUF3052 family protein [Nitrospirae bacterium]|nr:DUF3052 family protein [Nitrospirota bacterium]